MSLAISRFQYAGQPSPYFAMVASRNASPGEELVAPGVTNSPLYAGFGEVVEGARRRRRSCSRNQTSSMLTQTSPKSTG